MYFRGHMVCRDPMLRNFRIFISFNRFTRVSGGPWTPKKYRGYKKLRLEARRMRNLEILLSGSYKSPSTRFQFWNLVALRDIMWRNVALCICFSHDNLSVFYPFQFFSSFLSLSTFFLNIPILILIHFIPLFSFLYVHFEICHYSNC